MTVLLLAATLASVIGSTYAMTQEPSVGGPYGGPLTVPFLLVAGAVAGFAVSVLLVLPVVRLSDVLGRRIGGRESWRWVGVVAVGAAGGLRGGQDAPDGVRLCLCGIAVRTGLLTGYHPPRLDKASLAGAWSDGRGGDADPRPRRYGDGLRRRTRPPWVRASSGRRAHAGAPAGGRSRRWRAPGHRGGRRGR